MPHIWVVGLGREVGKPKMGWFLLLRGGKILQEHRDAGRMERYLPLNRVNPASPLTARSKTTPDNPGWQRVSIQEKLMCMAAPAGNHKSPGTQKAGPFWTSQTGRVWGWQ